MARPTSVFAFVAILASVALTACSGGNLGQGGAPLPSTDSVQTVTDTADALIARRTGTQNAKVSIQAADALGSRLQSLGAAGMDEVWGGLRYGAGTFRRGRSHGCQDRVELFAPDRNGDPNSTEAIFFYDVHCSQVALDDVRVYTSTGTNSETINHTDSLYPPGSSTALAVRTGTTKISNATFGAYGIPVAASGFAATASDQVSVGGAAVVNASSEFVMMPGSQQMQTFCEDSAGYDPAGIASLDETFGTQGGVLSGGTRTTNGNGFVTWSATPSGTVYQGAIGALSIVSGTQNAACPISTPAFSLAGGTAAGTYSIPIQVALHRGQLWNVTVRNATLPNGDTLNVRTANGRRQGSRANFFGWVNNGSTKVATFVVNAFGNGMLTITSTDAQYKIVDWIVVQ